MTSEKNAENASGPLASIKIEHDGQLQLLQSLERIIEADDPAEMTRLAPELLDFFITDLARHMETEEKSLFPLLEKRCLPSDDLLMIIEQLSSEHDLDRDLVEFLVADLKKIAHGHHGAIPARFSINAQAFISTQRRHIEWENRVVLPLAARRLTEDDLNSLEKQISGGSVSQQ